MKNPIRNVKILFVFLAAESTLLFCLLIVFISHTIAPPPQTLSALYAEPDLSESAWPAEKEPFRSNGWYNEREALFMRFSCGPVDLCCLGDSITQKFEWQDALPGWQVANRGIGSDTTEGIRARLDSVKALQPTVISLMAGINDLSTRNPEEVTTSYALLLDALAQELPDTTVIVNSVLPVSNSHPIDNQNVRSLNATIEALCQDRGLLFLNLYDSFVGENGCLKDNLTTDSVHLTPTGYALWLSKLAPVLDNLSPKGSAPIPYFHKTA